MTRIDCESFSKTLRNEQPRVDHLEQKPGACFETDWLSLLSVERMEMSPAISKCEMMRSIRDEDWNVG